MFSRLLLLAALLIPVGTAAQTPTQVWDRTIEITAPRQYTGALDAVAAVAARGDGVVMVVRSADGPDRLLAFDGSGKELFARPLMAPDGMRRPVVRSAAINGEAPDRIWVFLSWDGDDGSPTQSQLLSVEPDGVRATTVRLPTVIPPSNGGSDMRDIRVLRRLRDGSLIAGGTAAPGPPIWWYARFTTSGRLLHEAKSRRFPDHVDDVWGNDDGGYTLLMVDAEGGRERIAVRRFGADGKQALRRELPELAFSYPCAVLVGQLRQMRPQTREVKRPGEQPAEHTDLVIHEVGRGVVRRVDLGPVACREMTRGGDTISVLVSATIDGREAQRVIALNTAGDVRWKLDLDARTASVMATPDGGAIVVQSQGEKSARIVRYRAP